MSSGQYYWCCEGLIVAILATGAAVISQVRQRRQEARGAPRPTWPYDWRVSDPQLRQPLHCHIRGRR